MKINVSSMNFKLNDISDSAVGPINVSLFNFLAGLFEGILKDVINLIFSKGVSMQWLLNLLHLNFVNLD